MQEEVRSASDGQAAVAAMIVGLIGAAFAFSNIDQYKLWLNGFDLDFLNFDVGQIFDPETVAQWRDWHFGLPNPVFHPIVPDVPSVSAPVAPLPTPDTPPVPMPEVRETQFAPAPTPAPVAETPTPVGEPRTGKSVIDQQSVEDAARLNRESIATPTNLATPTPERLDSLREFLSQKGVDPAQAEQAFQTGEYTDAHGDKHKLYISKYRDTAEVEGNITLAAFFENPIKS